MGVTRIHFAVDELVLNGFPTINRDRVAASFQRELTRLLAVTPVRDGSLLAAPADRSVDGVTLPALPPTTSARRLGVVLARAVHDGLT